MTSRIKRYLRISPRAGFFLAGMGVSLVLFANIVSGAIPCVTPTGGGTTTTTVHTSTSTNTNSQGNGNGQGNGAGAGQGNGNGNGNGSGQGTGQGNGNGLGIGITVNAGGHGGLSGGISVGTGGNGNGSGSNGNGNGGGAANGCDSPLLAVTTSGLLNSCTTATVSDGSLNVNHSSNLASGLLGSSLLGAGQGSGSGGNGSARQVINVSAPGLLSSGSSSTSASSANGAAQHGALLTVSVRPHLAANARSTASVSATTHSNGNASQTPARHHSLIRVNAPKVVSAGHGASQGNAGNSLVTVNSSQSSSQSGGGSLVNLGL
jgi:hypothetical protein